MLDTFLMALRDLCEVLFPICGVLVLIYLCMCLHKLFKFLESLTKLMTNVNDKVDRLEHPLNTANSICDTIDSVHEATVDGVNNTIDFIIHNFGAFKNWISEIIEKRKGEPIYQASFSHSNNSDEVKED